MNERSQMLRLITVVTVALAALVGTAGCGPDQNANATDASMSDTDEVYYYLEMQMSSAQVTATTSGMPVVLRRSQYSSSFQGPINANLIGEGNTLRVTVKPTVRDDGTPTTLEDMQVIARIKRYGPSDQYSTPEGGKVLAEMSLQDTLEKRREELQEQFNEQLQAASPQEKAELMEKQTERITPTPPITMEVTFDSEDRPSFANRFVEGPVIEDTSRLKDYGIHLRNLLRDREAEKFYHDEYAVRDADYNIAYPWEKEEDGSWFVEGLQSKIFPNGPMLDFDRDDIGVRKWCEGRVWELYVKDGTPFGRSFIKTKGSEGTVSTLEVYVAEVDGELTIIR